MDEPIDPKASRRGFLRGGLGATVLGIAGAGEALAKKAPTEPNILGPYYRKGAPARAKLAADNAPGERLIVRGRVMNTDEQPLKGATVDVWQADTNGRYDNDDPRNPPAADKFILRGVVKTDDQGRYEYETILPGAYSIGPQQYRPRHIHYIVSSPGYRALTTQLYFKGDPYIKTDDFVRESLVMDVKKLPAEGTRKKEVLLVQFDIVLASMRESASDPRVTPTV